MITLLVSSSQLIADLYVLHRISESGHPLYAMSKFYIIFTQLFITIYLLTLTDQIMLKNKINKIIRKKENTMKIFRKNIRR